MHSAAEHDVSGCIVASLLKRNALVNMTDKEGKTPLYLAAERGHLSNVKLLIEFGAYVNMRTYKVSTLLPYRYCRTGTDGGGVTAAKIASKNYGYN